MIRIYVCEDVKKERDVMTALIENFISFQELDMQLVLSTANPYEILEAVKENKGMGLYFLDVDLNMDINGVDLASRIREYDSQGQIVFVTSHAEHMSLTFEYAIGALGYVLKTNRAMMKVKITEYIKIVANRFLKTEPEQKKFTFKVDDRMVAMPFEDIMFFEVVGKRSGKVIMYGRTRQEEFRGALSEIEAMSEKFVRGSRTVLINVDNITFLDMSMSQVQMASGDRCDVSRNGMRQLKQAVGDRL